MDVKIKSCSRKQTCLEVKTRKGTMGLTITKTGLGYRWQDFTGWDITDKEYYALENLVICISETMDDPELNITLGN